MISLLASMINTVLHIAQEKPGFGTERICYRHSGRYSKIIELQRSHVNERSGREHQAYRWLRRRGMTNLHRAGCD